jgi:hypothetical protein
MKIYDTGLSANFFNMLRQDFKEEIPLPDLNAINHEDEYALQFAAANPHAVIIEMVENEDGEFVPQDVVVRI